MGLWRANPFLDHCVYICTVTTVTCTCAHVCTKVPLSHHHGASLSKLHSRDHQTRFQVSLSSFWARSWGETVRTFDSLIPSSGCPVPTQQSPQTQLLPDVAQKAASSSESDNQPRVVNAIQSQWAWAGSQHQFALLWSISVFIIEDTQQYIPWFKNYLKWPENTCIRSFQINILKVI